jgi:hypothetical protein
MNKWQKHGKRLELAHINHTLVEQIYVQIDNHITVNQPSRFNGLIMKQHIILVNIDEQIMYK